MVSLHDIIHSTSARLLQRADQERFKDISLDSRTTKQGDVFFAIKGKRYDGHDFVVQAIKRGAKAVIVAKNISNTVKSKNTSARVTVLKVRDTSVALGKLAALYRLKYAIPLIAITGSSGKTTTKEIIAAVLSGENRVLKNFGTHNNHIGVPQALFQLNRRHDVCIVELGTNHFGEISYLGNIVSPQVAVITNIGSSHLEFLKDAKGVLKEKRSIIHSLKEPKILLLNRDDVFLRKVTTPKAVTVLHFGIKEKSDFMASQISLRDNRIFFVLNKKYPFSLKTIGRFNIYNALVGISCGFIFGMSIKKIRSALENFEFPCHRLRKIDCARFSIIDDSYNSNPVSLRGAVESLLEYKTRGRRIVIMGDMLELGRRSLEFHRKMGAFIARKPIDMFVTLGTLSKASAQAAKMNNRDHCAIATFDSKSDLIKFVKNHLQVGDTLLIKGSRLLKMEDISTSLQNYAL